MGHGHLAEARGRLSKRRERSEPFGVSPPPTVKLEDMRIHLSLHPLRPLELPTQYNQAVQGFIYHHLEVTLAHWLHEEAYRYQERRFKMFTFGRLQGSYTRRLDSDTIIFETPVTLPIASADGRILQSLAETLLRANEVILHQTPCQVASVGIVPPPKPDLSRPVRVRALSPITVYSTLQGPTGIKKTYYYTPQEREWSTLLLDNLRRKAVALGWESERVAELHGRITPLRVGPRDRRINRFKGTVIVGYTGEYTLELPPALFELAYDTGLGSKNAQGFGMIEVI